MSLFRYKVLLADGKEKISNITAKTREAARERVTKLNQVKTVVWIREEKTPTPSTAPTKVAASAKPVVANKTASPALKPVAAKPGTKLEKLLYLQKSKCFFCGRVLTKAEASIEHLQPKSGGGNNADGNVVACCVSLNRTFGSISLKRKFEIVLEKAGNFSCPR